MEALSEHGQLTQRLRRSELTWVLYHENDAAYAGGSSFRPNATSLSRTEMASCTLSLLVVSAKRMKGSDLSLQVFAIVVERLGHG